MKCMMCGEELRFKAGEAPLWNAEQYHNSVKAKTDCCNKMLRIYPKTVFSFTALPELDNQDDDWGH